MLGFPKSTEIKKIITKKKIYDLFSSEITPERRKSFDGEIGRITIVNEISPASVNLEATAETQAFFVVLIAVKKKKFDPQNVAFIARLTGQRMLLVINYGEQYQLGVYHKQLFLGEWSALEALHIELRGFNLERAWAETVRQALGVTDWDEQTNVETNLERLEQRRKVQKEIDRLEKLARKEKQPWKKFELVEKIRVMKKELEK